MNENEVKKSIIVVIDKNLWKKFKSKIALRDQKIGELVEQWIRKYVQEH